jgi:cell division septal protein FtsQ
VISAAVSGTGSFAVNTPALVVKEIKISGVQLADRNAVKTAAKAALGQNILLLKKSPIVSKIDSFNEVKEVEIGRIFPNKVWIKVQERKAAAILTDNSKYCYVQNDGYMYHMANGPVKQLPLLNVTKCDANKAGMTAQDADVKSGLEALRYARTAKIKVSKISVDHDGDMCLNMDSGFYVNLGQPDDIAKKMTLLRSALVYKPSLIREAAYIDISCPSAPVWKPKRNAI